jgi:hypothetical protein
MFTQRTNTTGPVLLCAPHLTQGADKVHDGVAVQLGGAGEDPVHGHHHALRACFRQRLAAYAYAASYAYAATARRLQRRHKDVAHEGGERCVGLRRSAAPAPAVMIVMVMTLRQRVTLRTEKLRPVFQKKSELCSLTNTPVSLTNNAR